MGIGRVMDDVSKKMQSKAVKENKDHLKLLVNSTHDTTIAGVLQTFGVYDQKWVLAATAFHEFGSLGPIH